jgi:hypothetical protein
MYLGSSIPIGYFIGLTVLALVIASLGHINTMMASVLERVRELVVLVGAISANCGLGTARVELSLW